MITKININIVCVSLEFSMPSRIKKTSTPSSLCVNVHPLHLSSSVIGILVGTTFRLHALIFLFQKLEKSIISFVKDELKKFQRILSPDDSVGLESEREDGEDVEERRSSRESFLKITLYFLRRMKEKELADHLQSSTSISVISM